MAFSIDCSTIAVAGAGARSPLAAVLAAMGFALTLGCGNPGSPSSSLPPTPVPTIAPVPIPSGAPLSIVGGVANVTDRPLTEIALRADYAYTGTAPRSLSGEPD